MPFSYTQNLYREMYIYRSRYRYRDTGTVSSSSLSLCKRNTWLRYPTGSAGAKSEKGAKKRQTNGCRVDVGSRVHSRARQGKGREKSSTRVTRTLHWHTHGNGMA